ncbi:MAG: cytidylate kinase-like family protein [Candidatus Glassbacteria bacterium]|nr:cytidylate kinase-like family protein [Candidatus Glassbacteria bacterium]
MQDDLKLRGLSRKDRPAQVEEQFKLWQSGGRRTRHEPDHRTTRFITISREYGCAGFRIADRLAEILNSQTRDHQPPWTVYDRKLVDTVCRNHKLSRALVNSLDDQRKFAFGDYITGIFTGEPSTLQVFKKFAETIFQLAARGRVILIGRGSCVITAHLSGGLHLRVVAPLDWRVRKVAGYEGLDDLKQCKRHVEKNDRERGRFVKDFMAASLKDPHLYDLVCNQQRLGVDGITDLIMLTLKIRGKKSLPELSAV